MSQIRRKKTECHSKLRKQFLESYFKQRRLQIINLQYIVTQKAQWSQQTKFFSHLLNKSLLQKQILKEIRQSDLLIQLARRSLINVSSPNNKPNLLIKKSIIGLCCNILMEQIDISEKQAILQITLPIIQSLIKYNKQNQKKQSFLNLLGAETFSFYINVITHHYFCFSSQDQVKIQYYLHQLFLELLQQGFQNFIPKIIYQDLRCFLGNFLCPHQQQESLNCEKIKRNATFIFKIIQIHRTFLSDNHQSQFLIVSSLKNHEQIKGNINLQANHNLFVLHTSLFQFYRRISYSFNQIQGMFNCSNNSNLLKLIMYGLAFQLNSQIQINSFVCLTHMLVYELIEQNEIQTYFIQTYPFKLILQDIQQMKGSQGLQFLVNLINCYLRKNKFKKIIQWYYQGMIDVCRAKLQQFNNQQLIETSLNIICLFFISGAQNLTIQINKFLLYFKSLNGMMLLQDIEVHFAQHNDNIRQMLQIIQCNNVQIQSSEHDFMAIQS